MFQIRTGIWETNSSSCNALVIPMDQNINFSTVACGEGLNYLLENAYGSNSLINWLYSIGVEEIKYTGSDSRVRRAITELKYNWKESDKLEVSIDPYCTTFLPEQILKLIVFGEDTRVDIRDDKQAAENSNELVFLGSRIKDEWSD